jgi:large repetitive protein
MKCHHRSAEFHPSSSRSARLLSCVVFFCLAGPMLVSCSSGPGALTLPPATSLPSTCTNATAGTAYNCSIAISGGTPPYTIASPPTGLPKGVTASISGNNLVVMGTPAQQQVVEREHPASLQFHPAANIINDNASITVADSKGITATINFSISISGATTALAITTSSPLPGGTAGTAYSTMITASGGSGNYTWSITGLPSGLS